LQTHLFQAYGDFSSGCDLVTHHVLAYKCLTAKGFIGF
jgi:hypothetical protein